MNKEILKRNIDQVIMQPCNAVPWKNYCKEIRPNGLSDNGRYILVKVTPDDTSMHCDVINSDGMSLDYVEQILDNLPERYRDHLVTLKHSKWVACSYEPVFDTDTQVKWDDEFETFCKAKQEWCDKHGCD